MLAAASIRKNAERLLASLPANVTLVAAVKGRTVEQVREVILAGVMHIGHNYVQEAEAMRPLLLESVQWHLIGHLQTNKAKKGVELFDLVETVDSLRLARELDRRCAAVGRTMPVLIEVNSGSEEAKSGVLPENLDELLEGLSVLEHLSVQGLMTMGPRLGNPEDSRPYFRATRAAFERLARAGLAYVEMRVLSMGMSNSYLIAIEEGATMVRLGTLLFES
ncbi:MAG TPA: YggS family pyridoxal phosphate-dependent enzyme [Anaerolineae bacterium]|nr:YggS family pyridoxal phosphate-dependent enzyme [Anaerolineae bacterium]